MITKDIIKDAIDKVNDRYLDALYKIVRAFERAATEQDDQTTDPSAWNQFIERTYGSAADDPIARATQGELQERNELL